MNLPISVENQDDWYLWECTVLPWCHTEWKTFTELADNLKDAIELYIEWLKDGFISKKTLNRKIFFINLNKNGKIQSNILKELNKTTSETLSFG